MKIVCSFYIIISLLCSSNLNAYYRDQRTNRLIVKLDKHVQYLHSIYKKSIAKRVKIFGGNTNFSFNIIHEKVLGLKHPFMKQCIQSMHRGKSIYPFFTAWNYIKNNPYELKKNQYSLLQEFGTLITFFYNNLVVDVFYKKNFDSHVSNLDGLAQFYLTIRNLPIDKMLYTLDKILENVAIVLHEAQLSQSILQWFDKYWWMPPLIVSSLIISIMRSNELIEVV